MAVIDGVGPRYIHIDLGGHMVIVNLVVFVLLFFYFLKVHSAFHISKLPTIGE